MKIRLLIIFTTCVFFSNAQTISLSKGEVVEHSKKLIFSHPADRMQTQVVFSRLQETAQIVKKRGVTIL